MITIYKILLNTIPLVQLFCCAGIAQKEVAEAPIVTKIDQYISRSVENGYAGSILVAKEGEILLSKGYGWANKEHNIPNQSQTLFNIGSVTKQFTAAAILKLMENGKLSVSNTLEDYFSMVPADKQQITIHQLLTHTSGISPQTGGFRYDTATKGQFVEEAFAAELLYPPGTRHTYANANYIFLAAIIEAVSQQEYESFLREHFWKPLQMNDTGYKSNGARDEQLAHGYYFNVVDGTWADWGTTQDHLPQEAHWYSIGKGDLYASVEDLYKWDVALREYKVLKKETIQLMEMAYVPENDEKTSFYGYGWAIFNSAKGSKIVTHNGSNGIYFADVIRDMDNDIVVIVLSNVILNSQSETIGWELLKMLYDENYEPEIVPKNPYELVFDFMTSNTPEKVTALPTFLERNLGSSLTDKALLNRIGFKQISEHKDSNWGIALLQLNTQLFPNDGNLWDTLGEGYFILQEHEKAIMCFQKAIALGQHENCYWCENSAKRLKELLEE